MSTLYSSIAGFRWLPFAWSLLLSAPGSAATPSIIIRHPVEAAPLELLAAREVQRYGYLRFGEMFPIVASTGTERARVRGREIVVGVKERRLVTDRLPPDVGSGSLRTLPAGSYGLRSFGRASERVMVLTGGDEVGVLYAAYRLAELWGIRFYLHGDVVPDGQVSPFLPELTERREPLFALRGIQPFHDFPEGPDWWNRDDYLAVLSQLPKLRMNFFGLHTYPEGAPNAEPTVWIGQPTEVGEGSAVKSSYPASYQNTLRGNWGYASKKTGDFSHGASTLFERDDYGAEIMWGHIPAPESPEACNEVFAQAGNLLRDAFAHARRLGVRTCVGTETPLTVPQRVRERLQRQGKDPADPAVLRELYSGIFRRIAQTYPLDYYWFWTPEGWTWEGTKDEQVKRTVDDLVTAIGAAQEARVPFRLATCGWVLGPQHDRALFDKALPKDVAVSCINREVGRTPVDKVFAEVQGRGKWAIPWMEDDPALTSPQLWVGRMRRDAADARRYGCDGLMGIHWRTRVLGPAVLALAQAAWVQGDWVVEASSAWVEGPEGGAVADYPGQAIADTELDRLYQSVRYNVGAYRLRVPDGSCTVTLRFCEPHYTQAGKRAFGVKLQGQTVIPELDIFGRVGKDRALDLTFEKVAVTNRWLSIEFVPRVEFPSIAAIEVQSERVHLKIDCGGAGAAGYVADWPASTVQPVFPKTEDFYADWATREFGIDVGAAAGRVFARVDGRLPRPSDWVDGPGNLKPDPRPWAQVVGDYDFVDELARMRGAVQSPGNQSRFDYWLHTFEYLRAMGRLNCTWGAFNQALEQAKKGADAAQRKQVARSLALPLRLELVVRLGEVYDHLLGLTSNPGELGTVANWEQHILPGLMTAPGVELEKLLGEPLPLTAWPRRTYEGPTRVIVPTVRSSVAAGEPLALKVIVLAVQAPQKAALYWRPMGRGRFTEVPLQHVARGVYRGTTGAILENDAALEYYVKVTPASGVPVMFPATAPRLNQTVVVEPSRSAP